VAELRNHQPDSSALTVADLMQPMPNVDSTRQSWPADVDQTCSHIRPSAPVTPTGEHVEGEVINIFSPVR
jgi:hypothetical protein